LTMATSAAYTDVKMTDAAWARMHDRANRPRPRTRFSPKSSGIRYLMLAVLICDSDTRA
jgi:hypothetical protein